MTDSSKLAVGDWQVMDSSDNMYMLELHKDRVITSVNAVNVVRPTLEIKVLLANDVNNASGCSESTECLVEEVLTIAFTGRRGQADEMTSHGVSMSHLPDGWILTLAERCADAVNALASYNLPGLYGDECRIRVRNCFTDTSKTTHYYDVVRSLVESIKPGDFMMSAGLLSVLACGAVVDVSEFRGLVSTSVLPGYLEHLGAQQSAYRNSPMAGILYSILVPSVGCDDLILSPSSKTLAYMGAFDSVISVQDVHRARMMLSTDYSRQVFSRGVTKMETDLFRSFDWQMFHRVTGIVSQSTFAGITDEFMSLGFQKVMKGFEDARAEPRDVYRVSHLISAAYVARGVYEQISSYLNSSSASSDVCVDYLTNAPKESRNATGALDCQSLAGDYAERFIRLIGDLPYTLSSEIAVARVFVHNMLLLAWALSVEDKVSSDNEFFNRTVGRSVSSIYKKFNNRAYRDDFRTGVFPIATEYVYKALLCEFFALSGMEIGDVLSSPYREEWVTDTLDVIISSVVEAKINGYQAEI
jgi:hypothetical protein